MHRWRRTTNYRAFQSPVKKLRNWWRLWALALGRKDGRNNADADRIAFFRTVIMLQLFITNGFIVANAVRHWNNVPVQEVSTGRLTTPGAVL